MLFRNQNKTYRELKLGRSPGRPPERSLEHLPERSLEHLPERSLEHFAGRQPERSLNYSTLRSSTFAKSSCIAASALSIQLAVLFCTALSVPILANPAFGDEPKVLEIQIQVDDEVSAIPEEFLPGKKFDAGAEKVDNSTWYRIPQWFAGQWTSDAEQTVEKKNLVTGKSTHSKMHVEYPKFVYLGCVKDDRDVIWERAPLNRWRLTQFEGQSPIYSMFRSAEVQQPDADHIAIKSVGLNLVVDPKSKVIHKASQEESVQVYSRTADGVMTLQNTSRSYDETGKAYQEKVATSEMKKVRDIDLNAIKLKYLRDAFHEYEKEHQLSDAPTPKVETWLREQNLKSPKSFLLPATRTPRRDEREDQSDGAPPN